MELEKGQISLGLFFMGRENRVIHVIYYKPRDNQLFSSRMFLSRKKGRNP